MILQQFRELAKWLTNAVPVPKRKTRRRTEETAGGFRLSAIKITRPVKAKTIYSRIVDHVVPAAWDLLDWLRVWEPMQHESDMTGLDADHGGMHEEIPDFVPPENYHQSSGLFPEP